jgi:RNA polymerase sigma factor (sigma-70 family)
MQVHWTFHDCGNQLKAEMRADWEKELPRFERLLQHFPDELQEMWVTARRLRRPERFETKVVVQLPTQTLVVEQTAESWMESFDKAADKLGLKIKRHKEKLRKEWAVRRRRQRREALSTAGPQLAHDRKQDRSREFFKMLGPWLEKLKHQVRRELRLLELEEQIGRNDWTAEGIVDEVLVRAWDRFSTQPDHATLDVWIMTILHEILDEVVSRGYQVSLDTPISWPADPSEEDSYSSFFLDHELATLADVLPDGEDTTIWDDLDREEQCRRLEQTLSKLDPRSRQAFVHHMMEGFDPAEVAAMQDREESEVAADIEAGRAALRQEITAQATTLKEQSTRELDAHEEATGRDGAAR